MLIRGTSLSKKKNNQDKIISGLLMEKIFDVCIDLRKNSKTFGKYFSIILSSKKS